MDNVYIISIVTTFLYCLAKLAELKFAKHWSSSNSSGDEDEDDDGGDESGSRSRSQSRSRSMKHLLRDAVLLFICTFVSSYVYFHMDSGITELLHIMTETKTVPQVGASEIFTGEPNF